MKKENNNKNNNIINCALSDYRADHALRRGYDFCYVAGEVGAEAEAVNPA